MGIEYHRRVQDTDYLVLRCDACHKCTEEFAVCCWAAKTSVDKDVRAWGKLHGYKYRNGRKWVCVDCFAAEPNPKQIELLDAGRRGQTYREMVLGLPAKRKK